MLCKKILVVELQYYDLKNGFNEIRLTIDEHYRHPDQILLVNRSLKDIASIEYSVKKVSKIIIDIDNKKLGNEEDVV